VEILKVIRFKRYVFDHAINEYEEWLKKKCYEKVHFVNTVAEGDSLHLIVTYE
jgi:hypothetical protein